MMFSRLLLGRFCHTTSTKQDSIKSRNLQDSENFPASIYGDTCPMRHERDENVSPQLAALQYVREKFPNHLHIYTDASKLIIEPDPNQALDHDKCPQTCGAAFVIPHLGVAHLFKLPSDTSVPDSEFFAVKEAVRTAASLTDFPNILILSDSLACVQNVQTVNFVKNKNSENISNFKELVSQCGGPITVLWIPGHCNIPGNEVADKAAKLANALAEGESRISRLEELSIVEELQRNRPAVWGDWEDLWGGENKGWFARYFKTRLPVFSRSQLDSALRTLLTVCKNFTGHLGTMPSSQESMPKVDLAKDKINPGEVDYMKLIEKQNRERALKLKKLRRTNLWTAGAIGAGVLGIYFYSMFAVKQESFLDDFNEPAREKN